MTADPQPAESTTSDPDDAEHIWHVPEDHRYLPVPVCRCEEPHIGRCLAVTHRGAILGDFAQSIRRRGLTETTIGDRLNIVRRWWTFIGDPFTARVKWRHVAKFIDSTNMNSPVARCVAVPHLHMFYLWAQRVELATHDPTLLMERPRLPRRLPRPIHDTDLALALAVAEGPMRAAILLAATSGLRCVEFAVLRWDDVNESSLRVSGKGGKVRVVPLHVASRSTNSTDQTSTCSPGAPRRPRRARRSRATSAFLRSIGVDATAHQLRHWCATNALAGMNDLRAVQDLLGHATPTTTAIYAALDVRRLRIAVDSIQVPGVDSLMTVGDLEYPHWSRS